MAAGPKPGPNSQPRQAGDCSANIANFVARKLTAPRTTVGPAEPVNAQSHGQGQRSNTAYARTSREPPSPLAPNPAARGSSSPRGGSRRSQEDRLGEEWVGRG